MIKSIYQLSVKFPKQEQYGLISQVQRAAVSVAANIAEGHSRQSTKEFLYHLNLAYASLAETETHIIIAGELGFINASDIESILKSTNEIGKMLNGLVRSLKQKLFPDLRSPTSDPLSKESA